MKTSEILRHNANEIEKAERWCKNRGGYERRWRISETGEYGKWYITQSLDTLNCANFWYEFRPLPEFRCETCGGDKDECGCAPDPHAEMRAEYERLKAQGPVWWRYKFPDGKTWSPWRCITNVVPRWNPTFEYEISETDPNAKPAPRPFANKAEAMQAMDLRVIRWDGTAVYRITAVSVSHLRVGESWYTFEDAYEYLRVADDRGEPTDERVGVTP